MLKEHIAATETVMPKASVLWRGSEVGECETFLGHVRLGHIASAIPGRVRHLLDDGVMHEYDVVSRLRSAGIKVLYSHVEGQLEVECTPEPRVFGHPDGILDLPRTAQSVDLDFADAEFKPTNRFYLLEVTAPSHFTFLRLQRYHMREVLWRKFVQIQMYLNSEEVRGFGNSCIVEVKNKNTSEMYEEGVSFDADVVRLTLEKLKLVADLASRGEVSAFRCADWRKKFCRYKDLCFEAEVVYTPTSEEILDGESLSEAAELLEAADLWLRGKGLKAEGEEYIEDARSLFGEVIADYGARGLEVGAARATIVEPVTPRRSIDLDILRQRYPEVYDTMVVEELPEPYLRVGKR